MRKLGLAAALAASVAVTGCATYPNQYGYNNPYGYNNGYYPSNAYPYGSGYNQYGYNNNGTKAGNAAAGAVLGGVLGASINGRQYYRDTRGYCYYVDQYGQPHYDYNTRC